MFMFYGFVLACNFYLIFTHNLSQDPQLPSFLKICKRSDPNLKKCVRDSVEGLRPYLAKGIPELDMPPIEPLMIPEILIDQGNGPVSVKSIYRDVEVFGPSSFVIKNVKIDLNKDKVKVKLYFPLLKVHTNYTMSGRILMLPISGSGRSYGNYSNVESTISLKAQKIEKNGKTFYDVKDFDVDFSIRNASLRFDNLFNGDAEMAKNMMGMLECFILCRRNDAKAEEMYLYRYPERQQAIKGEHMNLFLNDNWQTVAEEIKPILEETIADIFKKLSNKIFHKYPFQVLFPE